MPLHSHQFIAGVPAQHVERSTQRINYDLAYDGVRKAFTNRRTVIEELVKAIGEYRKSGGDHQAVHALNKAFERAELLLSQFRQTTR